MAPSTAPVAPADPYALKVLSVAELSRKAQIIVRATVGAPLSVKQGEHNWRVYPLDILETLVGDAQALPKIKYQDKGAALEKPAVWIDADVQEAPNVPSGETVLFLYAGQLDSPLVGYNQGAFSVNNSRVQGLPSGTPGSDPNSSPASLASNNLASTPVAPAPAPSAPGSAQAATLPATAVQPSPAPSDPVSSTPSAEKPPLTAQGNPVNTAAINSSAPPAPPKADNPAQPAASANSASSSANSASNSSASLPPSPPPASPTAAPNSVNGETKPPVPPTPAPASINTQTPGNVPLSAGQLLLDDFRKLVLSARSGGNP